MRRKGGARLALVWHPRMVNPTLILSRTVLKLSHIIVPICGRKTVTLRF